MLTPEALQKDPRLRAAVDYNMFKVKIKRNGSNIKFAVH